MNYGRLLRFSTGLVLALPFARATPYVALGATSPSAGQSLDNSAWKLAQSNPAALVCKASQNELANSYGHRSPLRYRIRKITRKSDTAKEVVETAEGGVARLLAVNNSPLSVSQEQAEIQRLHTLDTHPAIQAHRRRNEMRDAARVSEMMRLLPDAFLYQAAGIEETAGGKIIHLNFAPNPKFSPPDLEADVLTGIRGGIWIDPAELRIVRMEGQIFKTVDFGWGLLGSLEPGGKMLLEQSKTSACGCGWQLAHLSLDLQGKALLFRKLHIVTEETATDYHRVPAGWSYKDAVRWLLQVPSEPQPSSDF